MNKRVISITVILVIIIVVPFIFYFSSNKGILTNNSKPSPTLTQQQIPESAALTKVYSGILPCADCSGIETKLTLTQKDKNSTEGVFSKSQMYIGKDSDAISTKGDWITESGIVGDADAIVVVLNPSDPDKAERYLQIDESNLEMLDKNGNRIQSSANHTLTLQ